MYVCICKAVTDKQIRSSVNEGVSSYAELQADLAVGTQCGKCCDDAQGVFSEAVLESASAHAAGSNSVFKRVTA